MHLSFDNPTPQGLAPRTGRGRIASPEPARRPHGWYRPCKAAAEFVTALALLVALAPLIAVAAALVRATSHGAALFTQQRVGLGGRAFTIYKLRTMYADSEKLTGPCWSAKGDPRVTPLGRVLRFTHLDELPQLWNVLRGDMSLIGPRPERPIFVEQLVESLPRYRERLLVRPGLSGLAQVQSSADIDLESSRRKLAYDLYYIEAMGPWLDLRIFLSTALKMVGVRFPVLCKLFAMPPLDRVEGYYLKERVAVEAALQPA